MSGEKKLLMSRWLLRNPRRTRVWLGIDWGSELQGNYPFPLVGKIKPCRKKQIQSQRRLLSPSEHNSNKGVKQKLPVKWPWDGLRATERRLPMSQAIVRRTAHKSSSQWIRAVSCHPPPQGTRQSSTGLQTCDQMSHTTAVTVLKH